MMGLSPGPRGNSASKTSGFPRPALRAMGVVTLALSALLAARTNPTPAAGAAAAPAAPRATPSAQLAALPAAQSATPPAIDPAYARGYDAGYAAGQSDRGQGLAANPHKYSAYQAGDEGYTADYGGREQYQASFRSGFEDGYGDGYANRPRTMNAAGALPADEAAAGTPPAPAASASGPAASAPSASPAPARPLGPAPDNGAAAPAAAPAPNSAAPKAAPDKRAVGVGYREGYSAGQFDADNNRVYGYAANTEYKLASAGYDNSAGNFATYQDDFRTGFREGYDDGYNRRLYNSQIGLRTDAAPPSAPGATGAANAGAAPNAAGNGLVLAEGTILVGTLETDISTKSTRVGDPFTMSVSVPVWVGNTMAVPAGSTIQGTVYRCHRGGIFNGNAVVQLRYDTLTVPGKGTFSLTGTTAGLGARNATVDRNEGGVTPDQPNGAKKRRIAVASGAGAVLGGLFGAGILRGAIAGGVIGTAGVLTSRKRDIKLRVGETISLRLDQPVKLPTI